LTIVTTALLGEPNVAPPVGLLKLTVKVSPASTAVSFVMDTAKVLFAASPSVHDNVPPALLYPNLLRQYRCLSHNSHPQRHCCRRSGSP